MISKGLLILLLFLAVAFSQDQWELVWSDDFDGDSIDNNKWMHEVHCNPANREQQCYTANPKNSRVENGNLIIEVHNEKFNNKQFTSARMRTRCDPNGSWLRGKFEMRAILPNAAYLWPAFWLLPTDYAYGSRWPRSGEIDVMEYRGQRTSQVSSALHHGYPATVTNTGPIDFNGVDFSEDFHTFTLEWDENVMNWFVDGKNTFTVNLNKRFGSIYTANGQPWDQRFHIILNVAVGGNFFGGFPPMTSKDVESWESPRMVVDYVKVWQKPGGKHAPPLTGLPNDCPNKGGIKSDEDEDDKPAGTKIRSNVWGIALGAGIGAFVVTGLLLCLIVWLIRKRRPNVPLDEPYSEMKETGAETEQPEDK